MTRGVFVDSFAWIAAINKSDNYHDAALRIVEDILGKQAKLFTTNYVIVETINALSKVEFRKAVVEFIDKLEKSPSVEIIKITDEMYNNAWNLYQQRMDKDWGITDCTSFEVMKMLNNEPPRSKLRGIIKLSICLLVIPACRESFRKERFWTSQNDRGYGNPVASYRELSS